MRARRWAIAAQYRDPSDYDVPVIPELVVGYDGANRLVFADPDTGEAFIRAANPTKVRR